MMAERETEATVARSSHGLGGDWKGSGGRARSGKLVLGIEELVDYCSGRVSIETKSGAAVPMVS